MVDIQNLIVKSVEKKTGKPAFDITKVEASLAKQPPPPPKEEDSGPMKFLLAGNIVTAVARGDTAMAQKLYSQAPAEVKSIVKQQVNVQKHILKTTPKKSPVPTSQFIWKPSPGPAPLSSDDLERLAKAQSSLAPSQSTTTVQQPMSISLPKPSTAPVSKLISVPMAKRTEGLLSVKVKQAEKEFAAAETAVKAANTAYKIANRTGNFDKYNQFVKTAQRHYRRAEDYGSEAELLSRQFSSTLDPWTSLKKRIKIPGQPPGYYLMGARQFGPAAKDFQATSARVLGATPEYKTRPATKEFLALQKKSKAITEKWSPLVKEAKKLEVVGKAAPYFPKEKYADYVKRVEKLTTKIGKVTGESIIVGEKLKKYEPFSMTKERKQLIKEHSVPVVGPLWGIMGEGWGYLGGKAGEGYQRIAPRVTTGLKVDPVVRTVFGLDPTKKWEYGLWTSKKTAKEKGQALGKMHGEAVLLSGAFMGARAVASKVLPKPTVKAKPTVIEEKGGLIRSQLVGELKGTIYKKPFFVESVSTKSSFQKIFGKTFKVGRTTTFTPSKSLIKFVTKGQKVGGVRLFPGKGGVGFELERLPSKVFLEKGSTGITGFYSPKKTVTTKLLSAFKVKARGSVFEPEVLKVIPKKTGSGFGKIAFGKPSFSSIFTDFAKKTSKTRKPDLLTSGFEKAQKGFGVKGATARSFDPSKLKVTKQARLQTIQTKHAFEASIRKQFVGQGVFPNFGVPRKVRFADIEISQASKVAVRKPFKEQGVFPEFGLPKKGRFAEIELAQALRTSARKPVDLSKFPEIKRVGKGAKFSQIEVEQLSKMATRKPTDLSKFPDIKQTDVARRAKKFRALEFERFTKAPPSEEVLRSRFIIQSRKARQPTTVTVTKQRTVPKIKKDFAIPGSFRQLSKGLPRVSRTPTERLFEREMLGLTPFKTGVRPIVKTGFPEMDVFVKKTAGLFERRTGVGGVTTQKDRFDISGERKFGDYIKGIRGPMFRSSGKLSRMTPREKEVAKAVVGGQVFGSFLGEKWSEREKVKPIVLLKPRTKAEEEYLKKQKKKTKKIEKQLVGTGLQEAVLEADKALEKALISTGTMTVLTPKIAQKTAAATMTATLTKTLTLPKTRTIPFPRLPRFGRKRKEDELTYGFKVLVRGKGKRVEGKWKPGKFKPLTETVLPRQAALAFGQARVQARAGRTFKLKPALGKLGTVRGLGKFRPKMFTKKGRVFTEKTKFAIDTYGELQEITRKGIRASQAKMSGSLFGPRKPVRKKKKQKRKRR